MQSENLNELAGALAKAQMCMHAPGRNATNPHLGNRYADLQAIIEAVRLPLFEQGLSVVQLAESDHVVTKLMHSSGQYISAKTPILLGKSANPAQAYGAGCTYARRYGLSAMLCIAQADDDGEGAGSVEVAQDDPVIALHTSKFRTLGGVDYHGKKMSELPCEALLALEAFWLDAVTRDPAGKWADANKRSATAARYWADAKAGTRFGGDRVPQYCFDNTGDEQ